MLFINADREYHEGRAQNELLPQHIEKIVSAYQAFGDVANFAKVVTHSEVKDNDYNLNIPRYADNTPGLEPQDVRAHLHGGIPLCEIDAKHALFSAHGLNPRNLLTSGDDGYFVFADTVRSRSDLTQYIAEDRGVADKEGALRRAVNVWWEDRQDAVASLAATQRLMELRTDLLSSFDNAASPLGRLDRFEVAGVIASWWGENYTDLKTIAARGCIGLISAWESSILSQLEDRESTDKNVKKLASRDDPLNHKLVRYILPQYLDQISALQADRANFEARLKSPDGADDDGDDPDRQEGSADLTADEAEAVRKALAATEKQLKVLQQQFVTRLQEACTNLDEPAARDLIISILKAELQSIIDRYVAQHRAVLILAFETWWDKYAVPLPAIEHDLAEATARLRRLTVGLGYDS